MATIHDVRIEAAKHGATVMTSSSFPSNSNCDGMKHVCVHTPQATWGSKAIWTHNSLYYMGFECPIHDNKAISNRYSILIKNMRKGTIERLPPLPK